MTHLKSTSAQKNYIKKSLNKLDKKSTHKLYRLTEKISLKR